MNNKNDLIGPLQDPWEKWILKKAIEEQRFRLQKERKSELFKHQEQLRSETEKKRDKKIEEVYSKWLVEKRRGLARKAGERERLECATRLEMEQKEKLMETKSREKFREWASSKEEADRLTASLNKRTEERDNQIRRVSRLRAAEAYELWLIEHPFKLIPNPSYVNPQAWDDNTD